ncbi:MAG: hypothetical protein KDD82_08145 [Planctomycetes bacterium]|nr:hypothetical protein [Planctomycetota bacterium]
MCGALALLATLSVAHAEGEPRRDQERQGPSLIDHGYGFAYDAPAGWEVLDERGSLEVLSAQALAVGPHSQFVALRAAEAASPGAWVRDALASFALPPPEGALARLELDGQQAVWATRSCVFGGVPVRLVLSAVAHRGRVLGLTHWRPESDPPTPAEVRALWGPVRLLPGSARAPGRPAPVAPDQRGVGWRTHDGTFESAAFGLTFSPSPDLTLLVGDALAELHDGATVGWAQAELDMSGVLVAERAPAERAQAYAETLAQTFAADVRSEPIHTLEVALDHAQGALQVYRFDAQGRATCLAYGVLVAGTLVIQVQAEWPERAREGALAALPRQLACVRLLPAEVRAELAERLLAAGDPQHELGPDFVLRGGVYRDFTHRVSWTKPAGFWQVRCSEDPEARLEFSAPQLGLGASCAFEELPAELSAAEVHRAVRDAVLADAGAEADGEPTPLGKGGLEFLVTRFTVEAAFELRCVLATAVVGRRAVSVRLWGLPELVANNERAVEACLRGFRSLPAEARAIRLEPALIEHPRLGYRAALPGEGWTSTLEPTPDWHWHHAVFTRGAVQVEVRGVTQPGYARSESARVAARVSVRAELAERLGVEFGQPSPLSVGPLRGLRLQGAKEADPATAEVAILSAGDRMLTVVVSGPPEERPTLDAVLEGVRFLE